MVNMNKDCHSMAFTTIIIKGSYLLLQKMRCGTTILLLNFSLKDFL